MPERLGVGSVEKPNGNGTSHDRNARVAAVLEPVFATLLQKRNLVFAKHVRHGRVMFDSHSVCSTTPPPIDHRLSAIPLPAPPIPCRPKRTSTTSAGLRDHDNVSCLEGANH